MYFNVTLKIKLLGRTCNKLTALLQIEADSISLKYILCFIQFGQEYTQLCSKVQI